jgi:DNA-binding NarL/FixJ family response regulator
MSITEEKKMPPKTSRLEREEPGRVRVILIGGIEVASFAEDSPFDVRRCEDVGQATRYSEGADATVVLVDLNSLSDLERAHVRKQIAQFAAIRVLAIADSIDDKLCEKLLRMGCVGSLQRRESPATLSRAFRAVAAGELWFPRATLSRVLKGFLVAHDPDRLTSRELEILALVGGELNNQQIADKLFISRETVRWHIKSLHAKLGIRTRRGLGDHVRLVHCLGKAIPAQRDLGDDLQSRVAG